MRHWLVLAGALVLSLPALAQIMHPTVHERAQIILIRMHAYNLAQIRMGEQAARAGTSAKVRRLGMLVARYHRFADQKLRQIAARNSLGLNGPLPANISPPVATPPGPPLPPLSQIHGPQFDSAFLTRLVRQDEFELEQWSRVMLLIAVARLKDLMHDMTPIIQQEQQLAISLDNIRA